MSLLGRFVVGCCRRPRRRHPARTRQAGASGARSTGEGRTRAGRRASIAGVDGPHAELVKVHQVAAHRMCVPWTEVWFQHRLDEVLHTGGNPPEAVRTPSTSCDRGRVTQRRGDDGV